MPRRYRARLHFCRPGEKKDPPLPWSLHWKGACHWVAEVRSEGCPVLTSYRGPDKPNPRGCLVLLAQAVDFQEGPSGPVAVLS